MTLDRIVAIRSFLENKMITIKKLTKVYHNEDDSETKALDEVSLKCLDTGLVVVVGPSGSGKTTLLNHLGCLDRPTSGEVRYGDENIFDYTEEKCDRYHSSVVGFVFQNYNLLSELSASENIGLPLILSGCEKRKADSVVRALAEKFGIEDILNKSVNHLSGGQKQRVAILRAIINSPQIVLADEPTGNLDKKNSQRVFEMLRSISASCLVVVVTHDEDLARSYANRVLKMEDGRIVKDELINEKNGDKIPSGDEPKIGTSVYSCVQFALSLMKKKFIRMGIVSILLTIVLFMFFSITTICTKREGKTIWNHINNDDAQMFCGVYEYVDKDYLGYVRDPLRRIDSGRELCDEVGRIVGDNNVVRWVTDYFYLPNWYYTVDVASMNINECNFTIVKGRLPQNSDEVMISSAFAKRIGIEEMLPQAGKIGGADVIICGIFQGQERLGEDAEGLFICVENFFGEFAYWEKDYLCGIDVVASEGPMLLAETECSFCVASEEMNLVNGRLPISKDEIALSLGYAASKGLEPNSLLGKQIRLTDLYDKKYGNAYKNAVNLFDICGDSVTIVGVTDAAEAYCFSDTVYHKLLEYSVESGLKVGVLFSKKQGERMCQQLYANSVLCSNTAFDSLYELWGSISAYNILFILGGILLSILLLLQMIFFFGYGVKDSSMKIGVLRSLGVPRKNICLIFATESMLITLISTCMAAVMTLTFINKLNCYFCDSGKLIDGIKLIPIDYSWFVLVILLILLVSNLVVFLTMKKQSRRTVIQLLSD